MESVKTAFVGLKVLEMVERLDVVETLIEWMSSLLFSMSTGKVSFVAVALDERVELRKDFLLNGDDFAGESIWLIFSFPLISILVLD